eukprot:Plantae.Rhodophyta-Palmaria_palmata.ctg26190.p3 GENE.Plantae.Rhodophyta-Palmaria_palmata.ctg26190~~Plantae.Rhodophyta-Palmaria_palmata.ctg26190.p3  ORF type:complete len:101 (-),score=4.23 Plantae.Rhodophyta-Palmaria_palmata.ctg26190:549-815(-)
MKTFKRMVETSAAGQDGMKVRHLRMPARKTARERPPHAGDTKVRSFFQVPPGGKIFPAVAEQFASARFVSIYKPETVDKTPGIRPISI